MTAASLAQSGFQQARVGQQEHGAGMLHDAGDLLGGQPGVDGDQHATGERDREMSDQHLGAVRCQVGDPVTALQTLARRAWASRFTCADIAA